MRSSARVGLAACVVCTLGAGLQSQANVAAIYKDALSREAVIRKDMETARTDAPPALTLTRLRTLVGAFEDMARLFPTSESSDDALWHGGLLSADAFWKFGDERDRVMALRLLEVLRVRYPVSTFTKQLGPHLTKLNQGQAQLRAAAPPATPPAAPRAAPRPALPAPTASRVAPAGETIAPTSSTVAPAGNTVAPASSTASSRVALAGATAANNRIAPASDVVAPTAEPVARASSGVVALKAIRREASLEVLRVTLELDREVPFYHERIDGPPRVFIDLQNTRPVEALRDATLPYPDGVVRQVRVGRHPDERTRVVLDLRDAGRYSVYSLYNPYRLVFDFERTTPSTAAVPAPAPVVPPTAVVAPASAAAPPAAPSANGRGGFSLSRQLGLGISRIVIDPGHGGRDPGAKTRDLNEASVVLDIAQRLEKLLVKQGVEVVLTRTNDSFVSLEERTALANRAGADLFLSIHANASSIATARGIETYFLDFAQSSAAEALAARENAGSTQAMRDLPDIVKAIALNNKIDESRDFASNVQSALHDRLRRVDRNIKNLGIKQAPFMVLIGATMPSVLVEIAFLTHRQEATLLKTERYRQQVAEALFAGITRYQQALKKTPAVAAR
jgi:N-acetylmuramoyl-L-alanine amidase